MVQREKTAHILVADDDQTQLILTKHTLENEGYNVSIAENGVEALEILEKNRLDIVLLDVLMPLMDGFDTCRKLRELAGYANIPVLMVTGLDDVESINSAYEAGATDFISKPLNWLILAQRIRYMLRASKAIIMAKKNEEMLLKAQQIARIGNWEWNFQTNAMWWSRETCCFLEENKQIGSIDFNTLTQLIDPEDRKTFIQELNMTRETGTGSNFEIRINRPDSETIFLDVKTDIIREGGNITAVAGTFQDITERKKTEERLRFLANYDALTGLINRKLFTEYLEKAICRAKRTKDKELVGIMSINIDRFKRINDSFGQIIGDKILQQTGQRLKNAIRFEDSVTRSSDEEGIQLARRGADEFSILLIGINNTRDLARMARRFQQLIQPPFFIEDEKIFITICIGIAIFPSDGQDAESLLKNSDAALHHAKAEGPDTYKFYSSSLNEYALKHIKLENELRLALKRNQFELHYQPQIDLKTKEIKGAEALIRWRHPEFGMVPPSKFIPIAEETGLIHEIGTWVINTACRDNIEWLNKKLGQIKVSVNISALQFQKNDLVSQVKEALEKSSIKPEFLELELTESIIIKESIELIDTLQQLKETGVKIVVDDFGTGYSSLRYLKLFPLDGLKIDRSFVKDIPDDSNDSALSKAIMLIAKSLGLQVVAEGVETRRQLDFFQGKHCQLVQGFFFSPPLPANEFTRLLMKT